MCVLFERECFDQLLLCLNPITPFHGLVEKPAACHDRTVCQTTTTGGRSGLLVFLPTAHQMTREEDDEENIISTTFTSDVKAYGVLLWAQWGKDSSTACICIECCHSSSSSLSYAPADRTTTIHHWQLRDLISAADNEQEFYCVDEQQVFLYNAKTREVSSTHPRAAPLLVKPVHTMHHSHSVMLY